MDFLKSVPTHMDYSGQKFAEHVFQVIIVVFAIIGFLVGYSCQQLCYSMYILGAGCAVAGLITLPPWPIYRKDPITWQPPTPEGDGTISSKNKSSKKKN